MLVGALSGVPSHLEFFHWGPPFSMGSVNVRSSTQVAVSRANGNLVPVCASAAQSYAAVCCSCLWPPLPLWCVGYWLILRSHRGEQSLAIRTPTLFFRCFRMTFRPILQHLGLSLAEGAPRLRGFEAGFHAFASPIDLTEMCVPKYVRRMCWVAVADKPAEESQL